MTDEEIMKDASSKKGYERIWKEGETRECLRKKVEKREKI